MIELIGATATRAGLTVHAEADTNSYPHKIKISDAEMAVVTRQIKLGGFHGEWNYTSDLPSELQLCNYFD